MPAPVRLLCFLVLLALGRHGPAQHITIDSIKLARVGGLYLPAVQQAMVFSIEPQAKVTRFRHYIFDRALGRPRRQEVQLPGHYQLVNNAVSRHHLLYQFDRRGSDSLLTAVVDTLGRVVKLKRELARRRQWREMGSLRTANVDGFLLTEPNRGSSKLMVRFLDPQLQLRWQHLFAAERGEVVIEDAVVDSTHAWLLVTSNARSRRATTKAYCLALASGKVLCRLPLDYKGERRQPGAAAMGPAHSLLLAGYSYANQRPSRVRNGRLFYTRLHPDSTRSHDQLVGFAPAARLLKSRGRNVLWQGLQPGADGSVRLVGETYTSTSLGGHMAIAVATGIATLGIFRLSTTTLRPREVVSLLLRPGGELAQVQVLALPEGTSYTVGGYLQARRLAQLAAQAGVFRLRGFSADSQRVVLRSDRRILTMDLRSGQPTTVHQMPIGDDVDVWFVESRHLLLYDQQRNPQRVHLQRVGY